MKKSLAIVVLTWNDFFNTKNCIKSIYPQLNNKIKLILVDNNSEKKKFDQTLNWIKKNYKYNYVYLKKNKSPITKKITILRNNKNLGCGFGHNTGYKLAIQNNFEFIARIDNDMIVKDRFFIKLLKNFDNQNILALSPKIMYKYSPKKIWWMGTKIGHNLKFQKHMRDYPHAILDNKKLKGIIKTDAIAGCASIMRVSRLKEVGLSDSEFFYGPEDVEFSRRIFDKPGSLIVDLNVKIYHAVTQSFRSLSKRKMYFEIKYRLLLVKKIGTFFDKFFGYGTSIVMLFLYVFFSFQKKHRRKIFPVGLAILHFFQKKIRNFDREKNSQL